MPFNLSNLSTWVNLVRGISTTDQLEGGPGGVLNFAAQDLTSRTQWLYDQIFTQPVKGFVTFTADGTVQAADVGKAILAAQTLNNNITLTLPNATSFAAGKGYWFVHQSGGTQRMARINTVSSQLIYIGGASSTGVWLKPNQQFWLISDGTRWHLIGENPLVGVGRLEIFAVQSAPPGYLQCNGATASRDTFSDLFAAIGTTFGAGNGTTTFTLPDTRGMFIRGWDNGRGIDTGRAFGSRQLGSPVAGDDDDNASVFGLTVYNRRPDMFDTPTAPDYNLLRTFWNNTVNGIYTNNEPGHYDTFGVSRPVNLAMNYFIKF